MIPRFPVSDIIKQRESESSLTMMIVTSLARACLQESWRSCIA